MQPTSLNSTHNRGEENKRNHLKTKPALQMQQHKQALSYLEPNSQSMQKNRRMRSIAIGAFHNQNHAKKLLRTYLEPNRNRMQKPIGGRSALSLFTLFKGEGVAVLSITDLSKPQTIHKTWKLGA
jgi:hypothetical protein